MSIINDYLDSNTYNDNSLFIPHKPILMNDIRNICKYLDEHKNITKLIINYINMSDLHTIILSQITTITYLDLSHNNIGVLGCIALSQNKTLKTLDLSYNLLGNKSAKHLSENTTLTELDLSYNQISRAGKNYFKNTKLKYLNLDNNLIN